MAEAPVSPSSASSQAEPARLPWAAPAPQQRPQGPGDPTTAAPDGPGTAATARLIVGLKARLFAASLRRSAWMVVGLVLGALYLLGLILAGAFSAWTYGGRADPQQAVVPAVVVGTAAVLGWWIASLVTGRADATVHAGRFALYPVPRAGLAAGQLLSAVVGLAGPVTLLGLLALSLVWRTHPVALIASLLLIPVAWLLMVLGNRCMAAALEGLQRSRAFGEATSLIGIVLLVLAAPLVTGGITWLASGGVDLRQVTAVAAWTPWGAPWAIPADLAAGSWAAALGRLGVILLSAAVVWVVWGRLLERSLEHSTGGTRSSGSRVRGAGLLGRVPAAPWAAVAARSIIYWLKDPRYAASIVLIPVMLGLLWFTSGPGEGGLLMFAGPFVAAMMGFAISADVAYDHSAFSLHVLSGLRGRDDRLGRVVSLAVIGGVLSTVALVLGVAVSQTWHLLPGLIGMTLLGLLGGGGISAVLSARYTYPVPLPGDSPLKTPPGFTILNVVVQMAVMLLIGAVMLISLIPLVAHMLTGQALWGWLGLVLGAVGGPGIAWAGVVIGGRWLDVRGPELFQQVSSYRS